MWKGCNQPVCWKHFKFEYYIDHERNDQKVILSWHCTGRDEGDSGVECSVQRQSRNCCTLCAIMSPIWMLTVVFLAWNMAIYFNFNIITELKQAFGKGQQAA